MNCRIARNAVGVILSLVCAGGAALWVFSHGTPLAMRECHAVPATGSNEAIVVAASTLSVSEKLDRLSRLDVRARLKAIGRLSSEEQSVMWRAHWQRWLTSDGGLTAEQTAVLRRVSERATPEVTPIALFPQF